jgi:hypothetical protein
MKETTTYNNRIELALAMYKENVSPSETSLQAILSQIPEQQKLKEGRAVRSPYRWLAITQVVTLFAILIAVLPAYIGTTGTPVTQQVEYSSNPYYETDKQIDAFEAQIDNEDYQNNLKDSSL